MNPFLMTKLLIVATFICYNIEKKDNLVGKRGIGTTTYFLCSLLFNIIVVCEINCKVGLLFSDILLIAIFPYTIFFLSALCMNVLYDKLKYIRNKYVKGFMLALFGVIVVYGTFYHKQTKIINKEIYEMIKENGYEW